MDETLAEARNCFLIVRDKADIPALERGVIRELTTDEGTLVKDRQQLAVLDDAEAILNLELAKLDLSVAEKKHEESVTVAIAEAAHAEATRLLAQVRLDNDIAKRAAESTIAIRQAEKECELSQSELDRAIAARKEFISSISDQQMAKLTQIRDQDLLKLEKARQDQVSEAIRSRGKEAMVEQQQSAVQRLNLQISEAKTQHAVAALSLESLRKAVAIAEERVERRRIRSPLAGIIMQKIRHAGEWVEAGEPVLRVIRLDELLAEGFVDASVADQSAQGRRVRVECDHRGEPVSFTGEIVFVSPEIDRVNHEVQVRALIRNPDLKLRPGQPVRMFLTRDVSR